MSSDAMKMRDDMQQRTLYMTREMQRYQSIAASTSQVMMIAKKEMQERRTDIDTMRTKLDGVMERLYSGHEHNLMLQANIGSAQDHAGASLSCDFSHSPMRISRRCQCLRLCIQAYGEYVACMVEPVCCACRRGGVTGSGCKSQFTPAVTGFSGLLVADESHQTTDWNP
jgi:hypothetical protein